MGYATTPGDIESRTRELLGRGDRDGALTVLMEGYEKEILSFCCAVLRSRADAKDALQNVFVQAYFALGEGERVSYRAWLFAIALNRCRDAIRAKSRAHRLMELRERLPDVPDLELSSEERLIAASMRGLLLECLEALNPDVRIAVILRLQEGLTFPEMARILHEEPATLQARVSRALPVLRRMLNEKKGQP